MAAKDHKKQLSSKPSPSIPTIYEKKANDDENSNENSHVDELSSSNPDKSADESSNSEAIDTFHDTPQAPIPRRNQQLARSLIGELKLTPSVRQLITEDEGSEDESGELGKAPDVVQMQYTISKKRRRVSCTAAA